MPSSAGVGAYEPWSMVIHNAGELGMFGGAIVNAAGPGNVVVLWQGEETVMPPDPTMALMIYFAEAQPNCTRLSTDGKIKFMAKGTYTIEVHGIHQEDTGWYSDDYKVFTVTVTDVYAYLRGIVTGLFGMPVAGATVKLNTSETTTNPSGDYLLTKISPGDYTLRVEKEPWYSPFEASISFTEAKEYKEDVGLSLKPYILYGIPLAAVAGIGGVVYIRARPKAPAYAVPTGYRLVRE